MSEAIRCGQCRWWNRERSGGTCELNPPVYMQGWEWLWGQPQPDESDGCSRGEPKTSNLTVSDGFVWLNRPAWPYATPTTGDQ